MPYAPKKPFEIAKLFGDEKYRIASLVEPSIKFQLDKGADLVIAPYFFSEDASGDKFRLNHTLIPDSIKFMRHEKIEKPLFAMINIGNSGLGNPKMLNHIIDRYNDCAADLKGYFVMVDNLNDIKGDEDSLKGLAWLVFQLSASKDVFVLSIGAFGEVLGAYCWLPPPSWQNYPDRPARPEANSRRSFGERRKNDRFHSLCGRRGNPPSGDTVVTGS